MKTFEVFINQTWSESYRVKAKNKSEAKSKAWARHKPKKSNYDLIAEKIN